MAKKNHTKKKLKKPILRFFVFGTLSFIVITYFIYFLITDSLTIANKQKEKEELLLNLEKLKEDEQALELNVNKLKDPEYIARYLREKLLYSKSDEYIIRIPK